MKYKTEEKTFIYEAKQKIDFKYCVKKILRALFGCLITIFSLFFRPKKKPNLKYYASICSIFKDEAKYFKEWIEFHIIIGIDHFYLYNNFSSDNYYDVLNPYIENGLVTLIDWPVERGQLSAYRDCIKRFSCESNWIGFIDLDEFVVPNKYDNIKDFLSQYRKHASVLLYWRYFGTSGIVQRDENNLVIEDFFVCWPKYANVGKCFFNTDYSFDEQYHKERYKAFHHLLFGKNSFIHFPPVNVFHKHVFYNVHVIPSTDLPAQINHYLIKSYNEFVSRKSKKGGGTHGIDMHNMEYLYFHENFCQSVDYHAYKYLIKLKMAMAQKENNSEEK